MNNCPRCGAAVHNPVWCPACGLVFQSTRAAIEPITQPIPVVRVRPSKRRRVALLAVLVLVLAGAGTWAAVTRPWAARPVPAADRPPWLTRAPISNTVVDFGTLLAQQDSSLAADTLAVADQVSSGPTTLLVTFVPSGRDQYGEHDPMMVAGIDLAQGRVLWLNRTPLPDGPAHQSISCSWLFNGAVSCLVGNSDDPDGADDGYLVRYDPATGAVLNQSRVPGRPIAITPVDGTADADYLVETYRAGAGLTVGRYARFDAQLNDRPKWTAQVAVSMKITDYSALSISPPYVSVYRPGIYGDDGTLVLDLATGRSLGTTASALDRSGGRLYITSYDDDSNLTLVYLGEDLKPAADRPSVPDVVQCYGTDLYLTGPGGNRTATTNAPPTSTAAVWPPVSAAPTTAASSVPPATSGAGTTAHRIADGVLVWHTDLTVESCSELANGTLLVSNAGIYRLLDSTTGTLRNLDGPVLASSSGPQFEDRTPYGYDAHNLYAVIGSGTSQSLEAVDGTSGSVLWTTAALTLPAGFQASFVSKLGDQVVIQGTVAEHRTVLLVLH